MGPRPPPPTEGGSSTVSWKPPASTEQSQPPRQVATAVLVVPSFEPAMAGALSARDRGRRAGGRGPAGEQRDPPTSAVGPPRTPGRPGRGPAPAPPASSGSSR